VIVLALRSALIDRGFNEIYLAHDFAAAKPCCSRERRVSAFRMSMSAITWHCPLAAEFGAKFIAILDRWRTPRSLVSRLTRNKQWI
jgi:hypothetical protein